MKRYDTVEQARAKHNAMVNAGAMLTDEQAVTVIDLYDEWAVGVTYKVDARVRWNDTLYKCNLAHTSESTWTPEVTPNLWTEIGLTEYREIKDNMLSTEAFAKGEIGWWKEKDNLYESLFDGNVYTPDSYPAGWQKVGE